MGPACAQIYGFPVGDGDHRAGAQYVSRAAAGRQSMEWGAADQGWGRAWRNPPTSWISGRSGERDWKGRHLLALPLFLSLPSAHHQEVFMESSTSQWGLR